MAKKWLPVPGFIGFVTLIAGFLIQDYVLLLSKWNSITRYPVIFNFRVGTGRVLEKKFGTGRVPGSRQTLSTVSSLFCLRYVAPDRDWLLMIDDCCMHSLTLFFQIPQMVPITLFNTAWAQVLPSAGMLTLSQQWHATRWLGDTQTTNIAILSLASLWRPAHLDFIIR